MTAPLEILYQLTARDSQSALWGPLFFFDNQAGAVFNLESAGFTPPGDRIAFVHQVCLMARGQAAQNVTDANIFLRDAGGNNQAFWRLLSTQEAPLPAVNGIVDTDLIMTNAHTMHCDATFSANALSNFLTVSIIGIWMPRANVALF